MRTGTRRALELRRLGAFCAVGGAATSVHFLVVLVLVPLGLAALLSNVVGFLSAFVVSFVGHDAWTFRPTMPGTRRRALHRFFGVAVAAFAANEILFWALLRWTGLSYQVALALVLVVVGGATYLASRHWAFAEDSTRQVRASLSSGGARP